jgi:hypothetical protein
VTNIERSNGTGKKGDTVDVTYTEALAIAVEPAS